MMRLEVAGAWFLWAAGVRRERQKPVARSREQQHWPKEDCLSALFSSCDYTFAKSFAFYPFPPPLIATIKAIGPQRGRAFFNSKPACSLVEVYVHDRKVPVREQDLEPPLLFAFECLLIWE